MLLEEFDPSKEAVINPCMIHDKIPGFPETIVSAFSLMLFDRIVEFLDAEIIAYYNDVDGDKPVYKATYKGIDVALVKGRLGGPACTGTFEDVLAMGGKRIILLGNCGVLDSRIEDCGIIIPTKALRDEGTSFHYAPPSDSIEVNKKYVEEFKAICKEHGYKYTEGTTWTTDAFYRETPGKIERRKEQGAVCVEMECAGMQALCDFRNVEFFQFFYAGDNLDHSDWDPRSLAGHARLDDKEKIALLALELAVKIANIGE
ncbi:MAG: nucleoside phosphorylase [Lachnospiraceae bacterium]|nr:nucleoside phosphorylase [Lachnospiraceae bacterium]